MRGTLKPVNLRLHAAQIAALKVLVAEREPQGYCFSDAVREAIDDFIRKHSRGRARRPATGQREQAAELAA